MRYARADRLIQLALEMQAARGGLTLTDIEQRFGVSRRTAIRMRDAVIAAFPQADEVPSNDRAKRWRLDGANLRPLMQVTAEDLAALESAIALLEQSNMREQADALRGVAAKIKASLTTDLMRRIEPDLAALAQAEGIARTAGPRPVIAAATLATLRHAIIACRMLAITYAGRVSGIAGERIVRPLGFLYGHRHYLVASMGDDATQRPRLFSLPQISAARLMSESFTRPADFDLKTLAAESFGVFREPAHDVIWRFSATAAPIAQHFAFHPTQHSETLADGRLEVRFRAGGLLEMAWHLVTWGRHVEVIAPDALIALLPDPMPDWPVLP